MRQSLCVALAAALSACAGANSTPSTVEQASPANVARLDLAQTRAAGGRTPPARELRHALEEHECTGEDARGLFEIAFSANGTAVYTPPQGPSSTILWSVDDDASLCQTAAGRKQCYRVLLSADTLRLFEPDGQPAASLACS